MKVINPWTFLLQIMIVLMRYSSLQVIFFTVLQSKSLSVGSKGPFLSTANISNIQQNEVYNQNILELSILLSDQWMLEIHRRFCLFLYNLFLLFRNFQVQARLSVSENEMLLLTDQRWRNLVYQYQQQENSVAILQT